MTPRPGARVVVHGMGCYSILMMGNRLCVLDVGDLRREILDEAHNAPYAMHPGTTKMCKTLR